MRKTTDRNNKKVAPIVVTVLVTALVMLYVIPPILAVLRMMTLTGGEEIWVMVFLLGYVILGGAVIVGILKALKERLDELNRGEEDEASRY